MSLVIYITKEEALEAIKEVKTGRKEDITFAVRSIPGVKVNRSRKLAKVHIERDEEYCPHCHKKLRFYDVVNPPPKFCYCMWCGGAIERLKGNKNAFFDYSLMEGRRVEDDYPFRPTEGQHRFAKAISQKLHIPLPEPRTTQNYWKFIKEHQSDYYRAVRAKKEQKQNEQEPIAEQLPVVRVTERRDNADKPVRQVVQREIPKEEPRVQLSAQPYRMPNMRSGE